MKNIIMRYIKQCVEQDKDFTIRVNSKNKLKKPIYGYVVSITPLIDIKMNLEQMCSYILENKIIRINGKTHKLYIGGWLDSDKKELSTDISIVTQKKCEAIELAKICKQKAIYDILKMDTIYIN